MKKQLLSLCVCGLLAQAAQSHAWPEIPSWNGVMDYISDTLKGWKTQEEAPEDNQQDDSEETICIGSACEDIQEEIIEEEDLAELFDFDLLLALDTAIKLLPAEHNAFKLPDADLLNQMMGVFTTDTQTGINFFISLHQVDAARSAAFFASKDFSDDFRFALLHDTPAPYAAMLLHNLRQNLRGQEFYQRGDFEFMNAHYGTMKADYALISGSLVPAQYLPFIMMHDAPKTEEEYLARVNRIGEILFSMEKEQLRALFIYQPEEATIKIGKKNKNYCLGQIKKLNLCDLPMEGGINKEFIVSVFGGIADEYPDVIAEIIEHEYTYFPERGKFLIKNTDKDVLQQALAHMSDMGVRNAVSRLRPEVTQGSIQDIIGSLSYDNLLSSGSDDSANEDEDVIHTINEDQENVIIL